MCLNSVFISLLEDDDRSGDCSVTINGVNDCTYSENSDNEPEAESANKSPLNESMMMLWILSACAEEEEEEKGWSKDGIKEDDVDDMICAEEINLQCFENHPSFDL